MLSLLVNMTYYSAITIASFYKNSRLDDPRMADHGTTIAFENLQKSKPGFVLAGMPDDEGVRRNQGRPGANQGPDAIRRALYRLTPGRRDLLPLYDLGNLNLSGDIQENHSRAKKTAREAFQHKHRVLALGGGNDYAFPLAAAFLETFQSKGPVVINLDAHLDLRPPVHGANSGTPFYQLLEAYKTKIKFDFVEIGIQPQCNSLAHIEYAKKHKTKIFTLEATRGQLKKVLLSLKTAQRPVFLCVDMDAFSSAYAPGVSAPSPIGLDPHELIFSFSDLLKKMNICGLGIFEVAPPYDEGGKTAQLSAQLLQSYMMNTKAK